MAWKASKPWFRDHLNGGRWKIVAERMVIESGKRWDRPKLAEALRLCRVHGAKLIIAKLDRLARNVAFISNLMEAGVDFEAVDFPQANRLTLHIMAAVAEHEAKMISERTKAALAAAKARGVKLGGFRGNIGKPIDPAVGRAARTKQANARADDVLPIINELRAAGHETLRAIATGIQRAGAFRHLGATGFGSPRRSIVCLHARRLGSMTGYSIPARCAFLSTAPYNYRKNTR